MNKKLLKNKNFMLVILGNFVSLMGSNIQQFVLALYVLELTGSATIFASMLAISILPRILLSPIAGVFGDWFNKKKSIIILDLTNAIILAGFAIFIFNGLTLTIGLVYLLVVLLEITEVFFHSSMSVVLPSIVKEEEYMDANSFRIMMSSSAQLIAPVIGVLIFGLFGLLIPIVINAVSFLLSAISEMFIHVPKTKSESNERSFKGFKRDFMSGIELIKRSKPVKIVMATAVLINFSISPFFSVGLIFLVKEVFERSNFQLGLLQSVLSLSLIVTPLLITRRLKKAKIGSTLIFTFLAMGLLIISISLSVHQLMFNVFDGYLSYIYVLIVCFTIGMMVTAANIVISTYFQKIVPLEYMARTATVMGVLGTSAIPIGQMIFGYLYDIINPGIVFILNGFVIVSVVLVMYKQIKNLDDVDIDTVKLSLLERSVMASEV